MKEGLGVTDNKLTDLLLDMYILFDKYKSDGLFYFCIVRDKYSSANKDESFHSWSLVTIERSILIQVLKSIADENGLVKDAIFAYVLSEFKKDIKNDISFD